MNHPEYFDVNEDLFDMDEYSLRTESAFLTSILDETWDLKKTRDIERRLDRIDDILEAFNEY